VSYGAPALNPTLLFLQRRIEAGLASLSANPDLLLLAPGGLLLGLGGGEGRGRRRGDRLLIGLRFSFFFVVAMFFGHGFGSWMFEGSGVVRIFNLNRL
jgi:hypothetical protein